MSIQKMIGTVLAIAALTAPTWAQTPTPPAHHGLLGRLLHHPAVPSKSPGRHPGMAPGQRSGTSVMGRIIGNKKTRVYHLPGDKGALPAAQNRVYFASAAAAMRAGYHHAGGATGARSTKSGWNRVRNTPAMSPVRH